jgi:hypothetical protein
LASADISGRVVVVSMLVSDTDAQTLAAQRRWRNIGVAQLDSIRFFQFGPAAQVDYSDVSDWGNVDACLCTLSVDVSLEPSGPACFCDPLRSPFADEAEELRLLVENGVMASDVFEHLCQRRARLTNDGTVFDARRSQASETPASTQTVAFLKAGFASALTCGTVQLLDGAVPPTMAWICRAPDAPATVAWLASASAGTRAPPLDDSVILSNFANEGDSGGPCYLMRVEPPDRIALLPLDALGRPEVQCQYVGIVVGMDFRANRSDDSPFLFFSTLGSVQRVFAAAGDVLLPLPPDCLQLQSGRGRRKMLSFLGLFTAGSPAQRAMTARVCRWFP